MAAPVRLPTLLRLVEDLRFVARCDEGEFAFAKTVLDPAEISAESVEAAGPTASTRRSRSEFETRQHLRCSAAAPASPR
jgi:hypothetical protein